MHYFDCSCLLGTFQMRYICPCSTTITRIIILVILIGPRQPVNFLSGPCPDQLTAGFLQEGLPDRHSRQTYMCSFKVTSQLSDTAFTSNDTKPHFCILSKIIERKRSIKLKKWINKGQQFSLPWYSFFPKVT